jgi:PPOX class probable FMN-dependent enzyme
MNSFFKGHETDLEGPHHTRSELRVSEIVTTESQFRAVIGQPSRRVIRKHVAALDEHCRAFIARSPFVLLASADAEGNMDVSPKGDPPGFVRILDDTTVAIPERPGNRKADTFSNLLQNRQVGLLFLIPGKQETLRVSGTAVIARDAWLRAEMPVDEKVPEFAIVVSIREVFFHCAKCVIRSGLWEPMHWPDVAGLPSLARAMIDAGKLEETPEELQALIDKDVRERLY